MKRVASVPSIVVTFLGFLSVIVISGCGGGSSSPVITVIPITVSVSTGSNSVMATGSIPVTANVTNDASAKGVTWTVSCSVSQCGSVSPTATGSGTPTTYTAPSVPPTSDLTVTVKATSVADGSKSSSLNITVLAITLSVNPATATVQVGAANSLQIVAAVNNDPTGAGVSWTISPASGAGSLSAPNNSAVTYVPPASPPASDLSVMITATSLTDSTKTATATITVPSISISVTPPTATVDAGGNVPNIVATVTNDATHKGVNWSLSCSSAPCGSVSPTATASGAATTYTAPPVPPPADVQISIVATSVADSAVQSSMTVTLKAISVVVSAPATIVQFGGTLPNIVAVVSDDPANKGVTWSIQCGVPQCGSVAPTSTASGAAVTYTAPTTPPASDLALTIVATSVSDTSQQGAIGITVPAIKVSVSPTTAIIPVNATAQLNATAFTAAVNNDSSNQGVSWSLMQGTTACAASVCGTVTPMITTGCAPACNPTSYAAPAAVPTSPTVTIVATSIADASKQATATITLTAGTVKLIPATLNFGTLKISSNNPHPRKTLMVTLTNAGGSALNITGQTTTGPFPVSTPCPASVASGSSCGIDVTFAPLVRGQYNSNLSIADNDVGSPQLVPLSGHACTFAFPRGCFGGATIRAALADNPTPSVPVPTGSSRVGTRVLDLVDANRADPYLQNGAKRELLVRFWYPATTAKQCNPAPYTSSGVLNYLSQMEKVPVPQVKTNSCQDASIAGGIHPLVVFTHGYTGTFTDYTFLFEDLASRGYVVAAVNHTSESTVTEFPDGRLVKSALGSRFANTLDLNERTTSLALAVRLSDLKFVMNELERMNASPSSAFFDKLDLSRVALAGHSLGGLTALLGLKLEPRFSAAISIDGVTPGPLFGTTQKPVMMLFAGRDSWDQETCRLWGELRGPRLALNMKDSEHLTTSDAVWLAPDAIKTGTVGMEETVASLRNYIAAFLDQNLKGEPADLLLSGKSSEYPDVEVTTQTQVPCGKLMPNLPR